jgi:hypothetical protein
MRQGRRSIAEVHIARDHVDALILALSNRGLRPEAFPTRALAVRLRAPNGGFTIEAESAETIWIERSPGQLHDSIATWRWTVTPHRSGRNRLLLTVSARMLGPDGLVADSAPSDRSIEVSVGADYRGRSARWAGVLIALAAGGLLGRFSGEIWNAAVLLMRQITGA